MYCDLVLKGASVLHNNEWRDLCV